MHVDLTQTASNLDSKLTHSLKNQGELLTAQQLALSKQEELLLRSNDINDAINRKEMLSCDLGGWGSNCSYAINRFNKHVDLFNVRMFLLLLFFCSFSSFSRLLNFLLISHFSSPFILSLSLSLSISCRDTLDHFGGADGSPAAEGILHAGLQGTLWLR